MVSTIRVLPPRVFVKRKNQCRIAAHKHYLCVFLREVINNRLSISLLFNFSFNTDLLHAALRPAFHPLDGTLAVERRIAFTINCEGGTGAVHNKDNVEVLLDSWGSSWGPVSAQIEQSKVAGRQKGNSLQLFNKALKKCFILK